MATKTNWTRAACKAEAANYGTAAAFARGSSTAYLAALARGQINSLFPPPKPAPAPPVKRKPSGTRSTIGELVEAAKEYSTRSEFSRKNPHKYASIRRRADRHIVAPHLWDANGGDQRRAKGKGKGNESDSLHPAPQPATPGAD
jgi:hypothetical protein